MNILKTIAIMAAGIVLLASCDDDKSYAELLNEEDYAVNNFLADQTVILDVPADSVFETGENAPYYRLDEDGALYMQVLRAGTPGNRASQGEQIYFRYTRYALKDYKDGKLPQGYGNNLSLNPLFFRYQDFSLQSTSSFGTGIQVPLTFLPVDCEVNIVIKSTQGGSDDQASVIPYLYRLTYQRPVN